MRMHRQGVVGQAGAPAVLPGRQVPAAKPEQAPELNPHLVFSPCLAHPPMALTLVGFNNRLSVLPEQILSDLERQTAWGLGSAAQTAWGSARLMD